jgi:hypothetical protein
MRLSKAIASSPDKVNPRRYVQAEFSEQDECFIDKVIWSGGLYTY